MKTIFITGASTALGRAAAFLFIHKGWKVIAAMHHPEMELELSAHPDISLLQLDVTNPEQIKTTVGQVLALGDVDVVFNNAGYGLVGPLEALTGEQLFRQVDTNLLGVMRVTQAFLPHFRARHSGLFITATSIGGLVSFPFCSVYHATKCGLEGWSESMAFELKPFGISIKTVSSGAIDMDFAGISLEVGQHESYTEAFNRSVGEFSEPGWSAPGQIAGIVYEAATDGRDKLRYVAGAKTHTKRRHSITQM